MQNWEFFISDEEFTNRHKEIINQLYGDIKKSNCVLLKMFLLISSVVQKIRKVSRKMFKFKSIEFIYLLYYIIISCTEGKLYVRK